MIQYNDIYLKKLKLKTKDYKLQDIEQYKEIESGSFQDLPYEYMVHLDEDGLDDVMKKVNKDLKGKKILLDKKHLNDYFFDYGDVLYSPLSVISVDYIAEYDDTADPLYVFTVKELSVVLKVVGDITIKIVN